MSRTKRDVHGNKVALSAAENAIEDTKEIEYIAMKAAAEAKSDESRIEDYIEKDAILKIIFDELLELSNNTKSSLLGKMKAHNNKNKNKKKQ